MIPHQKNNPRVPKTHTIHERPKYTANIKFSRKILQTNRLQPNKENI